MTQPSKRTTTKKQAWFALGLGGIGWVFCGFAIARGFDTDAIESMIWASFALISAVLGIYQGSNVAHFGIAHKGKDEK